jgi:hypothetical protein
MSIDFVERVAIDSRLPPRTWSVAMRALIVAFLLNVISVSSVLATPCQIGSFQSYIDLGSVGCTLEDKTVFGFTDLGVLGSAVPLLGAATVTPIVDPGNPGLTFNFGAEAGPGSLLQALFAFSVAIDPGGLPITAVSLFLDGSTVEPDGVNTALLCLGTTDPGCPTPDPILLFDIGIDALLSDSRALPSVAALDLLADVVVDGGLAGGASLTSVTLRFLEVQVVPEPPLVVPLIASFLAVVRMSRRAIKQGIRSKRNES